MMKKVYNMILAIVLFSLRIPAIWYVIIFYLLFQVCVLSLNVVECIGSNPNGLTPYASNLPDCSNNTPDSRGGEAAPGLCHRGPSGPGAEVKDSSTVISEGLKTIGNSIYKLAPALAGFSAGVGTAKILKTLPPAQRAGAIVAAGSFTSGVTLLSQVINKFPNIERADPDNINTSRSKVGANSNNTLNSETKQENATSSSASEFNVDSPFEVGIESLEQGLTLARGGWPPLGKTPEGASYCYFYNWSPICSIYRII